MKGLVALITGAGSGMGRAGALRFAGEGDSVVVADIDESAAEETVRLVEGAGGKAVAVPPAAVLPDRLNQRPLTGHICEKDGYFYCAFVGGNGS